MKTKQKRNWKQKQKRKWKQNQKRKQKRKRKWKQKQKWKTKWKQKRKKNEFSFCFSFSFCFLLFKIFCIFVNSMWPRDAIDGQLSLDWPRSAISPRNMAPSLIRICRIQWCCSLYLFSSFLANLVQKIKIISLS